MKRAILIDGNNLLFRSYYATAYNGNLMKNSKDFPTNALYGFITMINKILEEENPEYVMVAFDKGKSFRHRKYSEYKAGRIETPKDLLIQFPKAYEILDALGIKAVAIHDYEADDIIGTFAKMADIDKMYDATIISSDKDLLQLISSDVNVKLLKQKDYILMNEITFRTTYGIDPIKMIDLKALMGDSSDNIIGVKGIGEKTALNLLTTYGSLDGVYESIDKISGKVKEKLIEGKESAYFSYELATIYKDVPLNLTFDDIRKKEVNEEKLFNIYDELEFYSLIKKQNVKKEEEKIDIIRVTDKLDINKPFAFYIEVSAENYHYASLLGMSIYDGVNNYFLDEEAILKNKDIFEYAKYTFDLKKDIVVLNRYGITLPNCDFDSLIASYLLNANIKEDISYLANTKGYNIEFYENLVKKGTIVNMDNFINNLSKKSMYIYNTYEELMSKLKEEEMLDLFTTIEMPLVSVLAKMEITGVRVSGEVLDEMKSEIGKRIDEISESIYELAGLKFNISSPKQLGEVLFEHINLPHGKKKGRNGYPTNHDTLTKLVDAHPIIPLILEHRNLTKLMNTYMDSLKKFIGPDGKIHTIFKQTITRTGRLSSIEPNLQNIPIRSEEGKKIRKAFLPEDGSIILTSDYSQVELRILAHISKDPALIDAFLHHADIHTKVASDIFGVPIEEVSKNMRRTAKAVIFGIVYGISGFGLGENLSLTPKEAKKFIDKYLSMYEGVKKYMDYIVEDAKEKGYVRTIMNRKREIDELKNTNYLIKKSGERMALNTPIQGSSADIIKKAMIEVDKEITRRNLKSKLIIQVHDELVFTVPLDEKEEMTKLVTDIMENAYKLLVPLIVEVDYGANWYDVK